MMPIKHQIIKLLINLICDITMIGLTYCVFTLYGSNKFIIELKRGQKVYFEY